MPRIEFGEAIEAYEKEKRTQLYTRTDRNVDEETIIKDSDRIDTKNMEVNDKNKWKWDVIRYVVRRILIESPIDYYQGMFEISFYIAIHYLDDPLNELYDRIAKAEKKESESVAEENKEVENLSVIGSNSMIARLEYDLFGFIEEDLYKKIKIVIVNVLVERYFPLVENEMVLFKKYRSNLIKLLKDKGYQIKEKDMCSIIENTLTLCCRMAISIDVVHDLLAIIISCPVNMPFILYGYYFELMRAGKKIDRIDDILYDSLVLMEKEFKEIETKPVPGPRISKKNVFIGMAIASVVTAIIVYKIINSKKD